MEQAKTLPGCAEAAPGWAEAKGKALNSPSPISSLPEFMAGICVIVAYRPKPGRDGELLSLVRARVPTLRQEGLVSARAPVIMRAKDGTIVEVSEWKSQEAIDAAHRNPNVLAMWSKFFAVCDCVPLHTLAEASEMFAGFVPLDE